MLSYASAYKMCVPTLSKLLNATARSRRAGRRACRLPDQLAWETLPGSAREGVSSYVYFVFIKDFGNEVDRSADAYYRKKIENFYHLKMSCSDRPFRAAEPILAYTEKSLLIVQGNFSRPPQ